MAFTFIQHLLENTPSSKEDLLEVNTEDFLNVLLAGAGEQPLREGELEGIPAHMTVGALIDMYEGRMPPPRMNYNFDEVDPDVDAKSFSRAGAARRKAERSADYDREMGFQDSAREKTRSGRFQGMDDEERMEYQMMHGTEEEEAKAPANRDKMQTIRREITGDLDHISNNSLPSRKRHRQQGARLDKRLGLGWNEEEESRMPADRDTDMKRNRAMDQAAQVYKKPNPNDEDRMHMRKRSNQSGNRFRRSITGK